MGDLAAAAQAAANAVGAGVEANDIVNLINALQGVGNAGQPERDIKLKVFESADPQEWLQWRARFTNIARCKGWNDAQQRRALAQSMGGKAIEATQHVRIKADGALPALTGVEALNAYEAKFVTQAGTTKARSEFLTAVQQKKEELPAWHTRISTLFRRAHPNVDVKTNHELIERFCLGMWDSEFVDRTLTDQPGTMTEALDSASRHAATRLTMERRADAGRGHGRISNISAPSADSTSTAGGPVIGAAGKKKIACFFCKKVGHMKRDCFAFKKSNETRSQNGQPQQKPFRNGSRNSNRKNNPSLNALAAQLVEVLDDQDNVVASGEGNIAVQEAQSGN